MLHARVVRQHDVAPRPVAKLAHHRGMRPPQHPHDAPLSPLRPRPGTRPQDFRHHPVAVHRIFHGIPRDEDVPGKLRLRGIRHYKAVPVVVQHQPPGDLVPPWSALFSRSCSAWKTGHSDSAPHARASTPPGDTSRLAAPQSRPSFSELVSMLINGRRSAFRTCNPRAISSVEAGSLLTCRKRNMLSGLKCEGRGIGERGWTRGCGRTADSTYFFFIRA